MDIFELAAKLTLDSGEYERGIEAAKSAAASFGQGLSAVVSAVTNTDKAVNNAADSAENLGNETANAADGVNELGDAEDNVAKSASDSADSIANAADAASDLADSAEASVQAVEESADSMEDAADSAENLSSSADEATESVENVEEAATDAAPKISLFDRVIDNLKNRFSPLGDAMRNIIGRIAGVTDAAEDNSDAMETDSKAAETLKNRIAMLQGVYDAAKAKVERLTDEFNKSAEETGATSDETKALAKELDKAEREMNDAQKALDKYSDNADDAADSTRKLGDEEEKTTKKTSTFKDTLKALFTHDLIVGGLKALWSGVQQIGQAFVSVGKQAVEAYSSYEQLTGGVETLFGNASAEIEKVGTKALVALSDDVWERLGEQVYNSADAFKAFENDVGTSMDAVADAMKYGLGTAAEDMDGYLQYLQKSYGMNAQDAQAMANAVSDAIRSNIDDMGDYAKNMAGIKSAADIVKENAANAFKTAGMSANQYMETVTSFSASLLQSLGGDTVKAAELADVAITDMSDKMLVRLKRVELYQRCGAKRQQEMVA